MLNEVGNEDVGRRVRWSHSYSERLTRIPTIMSIVSFDITMLSKYLNSIVWKISQSL